MPSDSLFARARDRARRRHRRYAVVAGAALVVVALVIGLMQWETRRLPSRADQTAVARQHEATLRQVALARQRTAVRAESIAARREEAALRHALLARQRYP